LKFFEIFGIIIIERIKGGINLRKEKRRINKLIRYYQEQGILELVLKYSSDDFTCEELEELWLYYSRKYCSYLKRLNGITYLVINWES
jgi:hypothetical protein